MTKTAIDASSKTKECEGVKFYWCLERKIAELEAKGYKAVTSKIAKDLGIKVKAATTDNDGRLVIKNLILFYLKPKKVAVNPTTKKVAKKKTTKKVAKKK